MVPKDRIAPSLARSHFAVAWLYLRVWPYANWLTKRVFSTHSLIGHLPKKQKCDGDALKT